MRALIIGGGIAGTATALALAKAGWEPVVFEAYDESAGLEQGVFLTVAANGLDALAAIDADGPVRELGFETGRMRFTSGTGKALGTLAMGPALESGLVARTLRRADLYAALAGLARDRGIAIEHGRRLTGVVTEGDAVVARFADGSSERGDLLVGADGLHSTVRGLIDPAAPAPRFAGLQNAGGFTRVEGLGYDGGDYRMIWGRRCFFGYTVAPDGELWWFANPPAAAPGDRAALLDQGPDRVRDHLAGLFAGDAGPAAQIIASTTGPILLANDHHLPRVPTWHAGQAILVGDAAHAVSPASGQGASQAFEDAVVLASCLLEHPSDLAAALRDHESRRRERVQRVVAWGKRASSSKAPGPIGRVMRDAMMPFFMRLAASPRTLDRQRWLHAHHLDWPAAEYRPAP